MIFFGIYDHNNCNRHPHVNFLGLREQLEENPIFHGKIYSFLLDFPLSQPIDHEISIQFPGFFMALPRCIGASLGNSLLNAFPAIFRAWLAVRRGYTSINWLF